MHNHREAGYAEREDVHLAADVRLFENLWRDVARCSDLISELALVSQAPEISRGQNAAVPSLLLQVNAEAEVSQPNIVVLVEEHVL